MPDFLRFWRYYRYPAQHWASDIRSILTQLSLDQASIIDAPCGDGVVSYWLMKKRIGKCFELYDLSERAISAASKMLRWTKTRDVELRIEHANIHDIPVDTGTEDIWLLINSLFLLPDIDELLRRMRRRARTIIGVFPCITSQNYKRYVAHSPSTNFNEMGQDETVEFFAKHGYRLEHKKEFCYVPILYFRSKYTRLAAGFVVNPIERFFPRKEACYWLAVFSREDQS